METTLTINGMHCEACKTLITMELDEHGFGQKIASLDVLDGLNKGTLRLTAVTPANVTAIKEIINATIEYSVAE